MRTTLERSSYTADPELRARLQAFSPDEPGVVFPFSARLAREQGWTRDHARRVTGEYLRFVYLAATAGHPVTPSKMVDEAWHLHLTCTRSYWDELCARVLRRPLHHEPTRGGGDEDAKFADWYARTLESYRTAFGQEPPTDIWPRPGACVCPPSQPTPRRARWRWTPVAVGAVVLATVLAGGCFGNARAGGVTAAAISPQDVGLLVGAALLLIFGLPAWVEKARQNRAAQPRTRRERRHQANGIASDGCGVDVGSGDSGDSGGGHSCGGHGGCGGHGCGSGCGSGCGGGGCGGGGCGGGE